MKTVEKLRWAVCNAAPWIGSQAMGIEWKEGNTPFGTAHATPDEIVFDPDFLQEKSVDELKAVALHEALHVALAHPERRGNRHPLIWNIAVDDRVNRLAQQIIDEASIDMMDPTPDNGFVVLDDMPADVSAEVVYRELMEEFDPPPQPPQPPPGDDEEGDDDGDSPGSPCPVPEELEGEEPVDTLESGDGPSQDIGDTNQSKDQDEQDAQKTLEETRRALEDARDRGEISGDLVDQFNLGEPKISWKDLLVQLMSAVHDARDDYSYRQVDPSYRLMGYQAPTLNSPTCRVAIGLDTSGSIAREELEQFLGEAWSIIQSGAKATIIPHTADVYEDGVETIKPGEPTPELKEYPSGGTSFQPVFDYFHEHNIEADAFVFFTDGYGDDPDPPGVPVLWVTTGTEPADFGTVIEYEL